MARTDTLGNFLTDVADAIRNKTQGIDPILASDFDTEIASIPSGNPPVLQTKSITITNNGNTQVGYDVGYDGLSQVNITTNVSGGSTEPDEKDVNFYDYDGTRVYSYTKNEFLALTSLPTNPTHTGLTGQGWGWTLADAKTFVQNFGYLDLGQFYATTDGTTKVYVDFDDANLLDITFGFTAKIKSSGAKTVTINWGDGTSSSATVSRSTYTATYTNHTYSTTGSYVISVVYNSSEVDIGFEYKSDVSTILRGNGQTAGDRQSIKYLSKIKKVELGTGFILRNGAFANCNYLETVAMTNTTTIENCNYLYEFCYNLKCVLFPTTTASISASNVFMNSYKLKRILFANIGSINFNPQIRGYIPVGETFVIPGYASSPLISGSIGVGIQNVRKLIVGNTNASSSSVSLSCASTFYLPCLEEIVLGNCVCSIASGGLAGCNNLKRLDFTRLTAIPTMSGSSLGATFPTNCKIVVPDNLYDDWIVASNWSNYASQIIKASAE